MHTHKVDHKICCLRVCYDINEFFISRFIFLFEENINILDVVKNVKYRREKKEYLKSKIYF